MRYEHSRNTTHRAAIVSAVLLLLGACASNQQSTTGIEFNQKRFEDYEVMRNFRNCHTQALEIDSRAKQSNEPSRYIASAKLLEKCESDLGPEVKGINVDQRMRSYALSIQNYMKGGDISKASENLDKFKDGFKGFNLYSTNGSSFIDTMNVLLSKRSTEGIDDLPTINVDDRVKGELRRQRFWKSN